MEFYCFPRKMNTRRWILEPKMNGFGPQMGIACAFKSDLKVKWTNPRARCFPCMEFYCLPKKMSTQWWILVLKMSGFGPQMGIACAFKSDLNGKVDESKAIWLPM